MKHPTLKLIASTWTLSGYAPHGEPWSDPKKIAEIQKAGFVGIQTSAHHPLVPLALNAGLEIVGGMDIGLIKEVRPKLQALKEVGAVHVNVQLCDHDTPIPKALPVAIKVMETGKAMQMMPAIEWHRDTCTETPEKALSLASLFQKNTGTKLRMNFDHSHPAIIKHLQPKSFWDRLGLRLDLLQMSHLIHFRPFNGHHCQIPITNGRGSFSPEFKDWIPFCEKVIETWLHGAKEGSPLYVVPELGPLGSYGLSCFPDIWKDKLVLTQEIHRIWKAKLKKWNE